MMRVPSRADLSFAYRRLRSYVRAGVAILGYHRLQHDGPDPLRLSVAPSRFAEHLQVIVRVGRPLALRDAVASLRSGRTPRRAIIVTFDDGYSDNLHTALPLLERHGVPATMFVTSGNLGGEFWWDRLARAVGDGDVSGLSALAGKLERLTLEEREAELQRLERSAPPSDPLHRTMTAAELSALAASPLIEIGGHTVTHAALPHLPVEARRAEIHGSRQALQELLGREVASFAYPHGAVDPQTVELVQSGGYDAACCSTVDVASDRASPFLLPRLWVRDVDGDAFERWLRGWVHG